MRETSSLLSHSRFQRASADILCATNREIQSVVDEFEGVVPHEVRHSAPKLDTILAKETLTF